MAGNDLTKFIILAGQRTGSTWLADLLYNSHPGLRVFGEPFKDAPVRAGDAHKLKWGYITPPIRYYEWRIKYNRKRPRGPLDYLKMLERDSADYRAMGFKLMYNQLAQKPELLVPLFVRRYRVMHLVRHNILDVLISRTIMRETGRSHTADSGVETVRIRLNPDDVVARLERTARRMEQVRRFVRWMPLPSTEVSYEALSTDPADTVSRLLAFLDLQQDDVIVESQLKRINSGGPSDKISNFDEIASVLRNTRFAGYLDDVYDVRSPATAETDQR